MPKPKNVLPRSSAAIRWLAGNETQAVSAVRLLCHVKPGVDASRTGIAAVTDECIEVCVAGQPRGGEANKAVVKVIADAVKLPKSDIHIVKGLQSRQKVVDVNILAKTSTEENVEWVKNVLLASLDR